MIVHKLNAASIAVLGLIDYAPGWANGKASSKYHAPTNPADFAQFAGHLAAHYAPMGVHAWEIWNEENLGAFWAPSADAIAYTTLLKAAYAAIHESDPHAVVLVGGIAQPGDGGGNVSALKWLQSLYDQGAGGYFDAVADHPYFSPDTSTDQLWSSLTTIFKATPRDAWRNAKLAIIRPFRVSNWQKMHETSPSLLSIMAAHGNSKKKIWVTEVGAPTSGADPYRAVISEGASGDPGVAGL